MTGNDRFEDFFGHMRTYDYVCWALAFAAAGVVTLTPLLYCVVALKLCFCFVTASQGRRPGAVLFAVDAIYFARLAAVATALMLL